MTETMKIPAPTTEWTTAFQNLKARYPKVREPIVVALHILMQNPDIALGDAKAQAQMHGARITAASVAAAQRLLSRQDRLPRAEPTMATAKVHPSTRARRVARTSSPLNLEELIRGTIAKVSEQGSAEADRLREAMRKAVAILQAAVGS